jgi:hypothetical protein
MKDERSRVGRGWEAATWEGVRREQLRRWAALPLEEIVAAQEEMAELAELLAATPAKPPVKSP